MSTETIRINKLPKSKMQAVREYTGLRAFVEIGPDGGPLGYFIEDAGQATVKKEAAQNRVRRPKHNRQVMAHEKLKLGKNQVSQPYMAGTMAQRSHDVVVELVPASRASLEAMIVDQLGLTAQQATSQISYLLHVGNTLAVDE